MHRCVFGAFLMLVVFCLANTFCSSSSANHSPAVVSPPPLVEIPPTLEIPEGYSNDDVIVSGSVVEVPEKIDEHYLPVGKVYDIELANQSKVVFTSGYATIKYSYDKKQLRENGFIEDFMVYYYDETDTTWKKVDRVEVDKESAEVIAYTSHFTPFILAALSDPWLLVGGHVNDNPSAQFAGGSFDFCTDGNTPYIVWFQDCDRISRQREGIYVKYWNGLQWVQIGGNIAAKYLSEGVSSQVSIVVKNGVPTVGFLTGKGGLHVVQWNAVQWIELGDPNRKSADEVNTTFPRLGINGDRIYLTWREESDLNAYIRVSYFENNNWVPLGETVDDPVHESEKSVSPRMAFNNDDLYIAYIKDSNRIIVKSWDGSQWVQQYTINSHDQIAHVRVNFSFAFHESIPYFVWHEVKIQETAISAERRQDKVYCAYFKNNEYKQLGDGVQDLSLNTGSEPSLYFIKSRPYVAYCEFTDDGYSKAFVKKWNGTQWEPVGDLLNVEEHWAINPIIRFNGITFFVAFVQKTEYKDYLYVKSGNWNEPYIDPAYQKPQITKFSRTSLAVTNNRIITLEVEGYDDKKITHWMITGSDVKPTSSNFNWQTEKPLDCNMLNVPPGKYSLYIWAMDEEGNVSDLFPPAIVELYGVALESASRQNLGSGFFGGEGTRLAKNDYPVSTPIQEGVDFGYEKALDNSDGAGYTLYDPTGFNNEPGTCFRIIENGKNVADPEGLHLTPIAKNLAVFQAPPSNQVYIDPLRGQFVLPRPLYWSRCESLDAMINAEIQYGTCTTAFTGTEPTEIEVAGFAGNGLSLSYLMDSCNRKGSYTIEISNKDDEGYTTGSISFWVLLDTAYSGNKKPSDTAYSICTLRVGNPQIFSLSARSLDGSDVALYLSTSSHIYIHNAVAERGSWMHLYIVWDQLGNLHDGCRMNIYANGKIINASNPNLLNTKVNSYSFTLGAIATGLFIPPIAGTLIDGFSSMSKCAIDNIKIWNHIVGDPENYSRWLYEFEQTSSDDALHAIYSRENGYRPVLDSDRGSGVGYYPIQAGK